MSKKRKSFILHYDSLNVLDDLSDEQAGLLFKAIKAYHFDDELTLDTLTNIAMSPFRNQFERDAEKYEKLCEKNRLIAESRYNTKSTTGKAGDQTLPKATKSTDNDSKSDSDSDSKVTNTLPIVIDKFSNDDLRCAEWFYSRLLVLNSEHKKPDIKKWADVIRLMREIDKRTYQQISDLFLWVNTDDFWQGNILSPVKLRKQWDALTIKMNSSSGSKNNAKLDMDLNDTSWAKNIDDVL